MTATQSRVRRTRPVIIGVVLCMVTLCGGAYMVSGLLKSKVQPAKQVVQEVRIIRPPEQPPPPPPPPPEEKVDVPQPQDQPQPDQHSNDTPPGEQLGVDAAGSGSGDGFGLVGRPGGRDLLTSGGSALTWYGGVVKDEILARLEDDPKIRSGGYTVNVRLWITLEGQVERVTLVGSTGDRDRDRAIEGALAQLTRISRPPPTGMPQPVTLRIVSRT